jgi:hypothetical protein
MVRFAALVVGVLLLAAPVAGQEDPEASRLPPTPPPPALPAAPSVPAVVPATPALPDPDAAARASAGVTAKQLEDLGRLTQLPPSFLLERLQGDPALREPTLAALAVVEDRMRAGRDRKAGGWMLGLAGGLGLTIGLLQALSDGLSSPYGSDPYGRKRSPSVVVPAAGLVAMVVGIAIGISGANRLDHPGAEEKKAASDLAARFRTSEASAAPR